MPRWSVALLGPYHHLPTTGELNLATPAIGLVLCLRHLLVVLVEESDVLIPGISCGIHAECHPPQTAFWHGEQT